MSLAVTLYLIVTVVLFGLNVIVNIFALALGDKKEFPASTVIATIFAIIFVVWGTTVLVSN